MDVWLCCRIIDPTPVVTSPILSNRSKNDNDLPSARLCEVVSNVELSAGSPASGHSGGAQLHISMELQRFEPVEDRAVSAPRQTGTVRDWLDPSNSLSFHL
jgi:hypothetical protein